MTTQTPTKFNGPGDRRPAAAPDQEPEPAIVAPTAPAVNGRGTTSAPVSASKRKPGFIVAAAFAGVAVIGGAIALIGSARVEAEPVGRVDLPLPAPEPGPTPPTLPVVTIPGPQPSPEVRGRTPQTEPAPTPEPVSSANRQTVLGDISMDVPDGWEVIVAEEGAVVVGTEGAQFTVIAGEVNADAETLVGLWTSGLDDLDAVTVLDGDAINPPTASIVSAAYAIYTAILPTPQGSIPVEATVIGLVTQDGIAVVMETFNQLGESERYGEDYGVMVESLVTSL